MRTNFNVDDIIGLVERYGAAVAENGSEEAEQLLAQIQGAMVKAAIDGTFLTGMAIGDGSLRFGLQGGACEMFAAAFADQFIDANAINYVEAIFHHSAVGQLVVTLQKVEGKTPHQLRMAAEQERDAALAKHQGHA